jgi:hypothetical protein
LLLILIYLFSHRDREKDTLFLDDCISKGWILGRGENFYLKEQRKFTIENFGM